ncbi:MAG: CopG family transcriptional regulator [Planctomycetes bacterium]|nr:CopG family transcriptional regulator [Planctomycetota bacterium]
MKKTASFQMDAEMLTTLDEVANQEAKNRSALLRDLIEKFLAQEPLTTSTGTTSPESSTEA